MLGMNLKQMDDNQRFAFIASRFGHYDFKAPLQYVATMYNEYINNTPFYNGVDVIGIPLG